MGFHVPHDVAFRALNNRWFVLALWPNENAKLVLARSWLGVLADLHSKWMDTAISWRVIDRKDARPQAKHLAADR